MDFTTYLILNGIISVINGIISLIIGGFGSDRRIGFFNAFIISFLFSAIIGLIVVLLSKNNEDIQREEAMFKTHKEALKEQKTKNKKNNADDKSRLIENLSKLSDLKKNGILTDRAFQEAKEKLLTLDLTT